jgi:sugar/nucleoside kinase (ribokinase family)
MGRVVSFVSVGDVLLDVLVARGAGPHDAAVRARPGGSAANAAVWAVAAGASARCVGRVGDDDVGRALRDALVRHGVDARLSVDEDAPTGVAAEVDGLPAVDRGATATLRPEHLDDSTDADVVLVSGHLLAFPDTRRAGSAALREGAARWRAVDAGRTALEPGLLAGADALFLDGGRVDDPEALARTLGARHRLVCVTLGPAGVIGVLDGEAERAAPPSVHAGPARGAGDAFAAGTLVALAAGLDLAEALARGCTLGAAAAADGWPPRRA